jgi:hypothetical protein
MVRQERRHMTQSSLPTIATPENEGERALRISLANREQIADLQDLVGRPAVSSKVGDEGTGAMQVLFRLNAGIQKLTLAVDNLSGRIDKEQEARLADIEARKVEAEARTKAAAAETAAAEAATAKRREPWSWGTRVAIGTAIATVVASVLGLSATYIRGHWRDDTPAARP